MIALHNCPFTIVEDVGMLFVFSLMNAAFVCYGADHFSTVILQDCVKWATWTITQDLLKQLWIHFTSDLWLCQLTGYHMLSVTAHWVDASSFKSRHVVLMVLKMVGKAVNENIFIGWCNIFLDWGLLTLKPGKRRLELHDNLHREREEYVTYSRKDFVTWRKIREFCCDGGGNLWSALKRMPKCQSTFSRRCVSHLLQGIAKGACSRVLSVNNCITNAKACMEYINRSYPI
jgi:hypothetical protein